MRFSIVLPDEAGAALRELAEGSGLSQSEFTRRAVLAACSPGPHPPAPLDDAERTRLEEAIRIAAADRDQAREALARLEAEAVTAAADRDRLTERIRVLEDQARTAAADLAARDQRLIEKADEINWLRGEVSKLNDKLAPAMIPETTGHGRRPWWAIWRRAE